MMTAHKKASRDCAPEASKNNCTNNKQCSINKQATNNAWLYRYAALVPALAAAILLTVAFFKWIGGAL